MKIKIIDNDKVREISSDNAMLLSDAVKASGLWLDMPCNGKGTCGKCKVSVLGDLSEATQQEKQKLGEQDNNHIRLACMTYAVGDCTVILQQKKQASIISDGFLPNFTLAPQGNHYGFAVDIGTTTVVIYLYDLKSGTLIGKTAFSNPQADFGADVISRIQSALDGKADDLKNKIFGSLETGFQNLCQSHCVSDREVDSIVITGNTTMLYLLCGQNTRPLSCAPFEIDERYGKFCSDGALPFSSFPNAAVYLPRCISAFVGADITCSILSSDMMQKEETSIMVDIGTNGEMALYHNHQLYCCSTAAGPAFEGAKITMGLPAVNGAINKVYIENDAICYTTISGEKPIGVCGTGLIDAIAAFVTTGIIDETGYIDEENERFSQYFTQYQDQPAVKIGDSGIMITQADIRNVQLAKSAICSGIYSLIHEAGLQEQEVGHLFLAGGFGSFINPESAAAIGLIPNELASKTKVLGNAAGMGAVLIMLSVPKQLESEKIAKCAQYIELSSSSYFTDKYVECMMFYNALTE